MKERKDWRQNSIKNVQEPCHIPWETHLYMHTHTGSVTNSLTWTNVLKNMCKIIKRRIQTDQKRETLDLRLTGYNTPICRVTCDTISLQATRTTLWMKHLPFIYQAISAASFSPCDTCLPLSVSVRRVGFQRWRGGKLGRRSEKIIKKDIMDRGRQWWWWRQLVWWK